MLQYIKTICMWIAIFYNKLCLSIRNDYLIIGIFANICKVNLQCGSCRAWHYFHSQDTTVLVNRIILKKLRIRRSGRLEIYVFPKLLCYKVLKLLSKSNEFPQYNWLAFLFLLSCHINHVATLFSYSKNLYY